VGGVNRTDASLPATLIVFVKEKLANILLPGLVLALAAAGALLAIRSWLWLVTVVGRSMEPTFWDGETILAARRWPARWLRRGSIVLIKGVAQSNELSPCFFVKRVAFLPGDRINLPQERSGTGLHWRGQVPDESRPQQTLTHDQVFVISDNLSGGMDSRSWGPVQMSALAGLVLMRLPRSQQER
jgi:signal peptidase I